MVILANHHGKDFMGFVDMPKPNISPFNLKCSHRLADVVRKQRKVMRPIYPKVWARDFAKLRSVDGLKKKHIRKVLDWYLLHLGEEYIPQAYSAKGFREKFEAIERAMLRDQKRNPQLTISDLAKEIAGNCRNVNWPKGSDAKLPIAVQLSLDNFVKLHKAHSEYGKELEKLSRNKSANISLCSFWMTMSTELHNAKSFIMRWFTIYIHKRRAKWKDWNGDLVKDAFSKDHPFFQEIGKKLSNDFSGSLQHWKTYMERINEFLKNDD